MTRPGATETLAVLVLVAPAPRGRDGLDLLREQAEVQRAGGLVRVDVLTFALVALHDMSSLRLEAVRSTEADQHTLGYHRAPELPPGLPAHLSSPTLPSGRTPRGLPHGPSR